MRLLLVSMIVAGFAVAAPDARADHTPPAWEGGVGVVTAQESLFSQISSRIATRNTLVVCNSPEEWAYIASVRGFDPNRVAGFVTAINGVVQPWAELHPVICDGLD